LKKKSHLLVFFVCIWQDHWRFWSHKIFAPVTFEDQLGIQVIYFYLENNSQGSKLVVIDVFLQVNLLLFDL